MFVDDRDTGIGIPLIKDCQFDPFETVLLKSLLRQGMKVLDIGANIGFFTLIAAKCVGGQGHVYAYEPQRYNYRLLNLNLAVNRCANVTPQNKAVSDSCGKIRLYEDTVNYGAHSIADGNLIGHGGSKFVDAVTLDTIAASIPGTDFDLIKLDTQGAEGLIIRGGEKTLTQTNPKMIIEFWPWGLRNLGTDPAWLLQRLRELGYRIKVIDEQDQTLKERGFAEIIDYCDSHANGWGFYNLFLEKP
jgi:methyltransferase, FkbM family